MPIKLYDSFTRANQTLAKNTNRAFFMYCCGPTVYGPAHIGNFRTFLIQDVLRRVLEVDGFNVKHVRNITDLDDKTIRESQAKNQSLKEFTNYWTEKFHTDCKKLNLLTPSLEPKAVEHIKEMIELVEELIKKNHAYVGGDGSVYFDVSSCKNYGKLNRIDQSELKTQISNSSGEANLADEYDRESVSDFALWKSWKKEDGENYWKSPWGKGRPGWHLECSSMIYKSFEGNTIDLHGGGIDLSFPHHENEIAQSESAYGKPLSNHWFHCAHLKVENKKMSKSLRNLYTLDEILDEGHSPTALRYTLISSSYRQPLNFTFDGLRASETALKKIENFTENLLRKLNYDTMQFNEQYVKIHRLEDFGLLRNAWEGLCNNLNTSACLGSLFGLIGSNPAKKLNLSETEQLLKALGSILYALGLRLFSDQKQNYEAPITILNIANERWEAKLDKNYAKADTLRKCLQNNGWDVKDMPTNYQLFPLNK